MDFTTPPSPDGEAVHIASGSLNQLVAGVQRRDGIVGVVCQDNRTRPGYGNRSRKLVHDRGENKEGKEGEKEGH